MDGDLFPGSTTFLKEREDRDHATASRMGASKRVFLSSSNVEACTIAANASAVSMCPFAHAVPKPGS
jgi:hypothetical protein